ncbi:TPA: EpsG family protein [Vibrio vulnificus]
MLIYYFPLILIFLSYCILFSNKKEVNILFYFFLGTVIIILCGFRVNSDVDYGPYIGLFNETPKLTSLTREILSQLYGEVGYLYFTSVVKEIGLSFVAVTITFSTFSVITKMYFIRKFCRQNYAAITFSLYLCFCFITVEFIELRWSLASGLTALSIYYSLQNYYFRNLIFVAIAGLFHYFSLAFIFVFALRIVSLKQSILIFISCFVIALFYKFFSIDFFIAIESELFIVTRFLRYVNEIESSLGLFSYLKCLMYFAVFLIFIKLFSLSDQEEKMIKTSLVLLSFSLFISFVPLLFYRSMVISDLVNITTMLMLLGNSHFKKSEELLICTIFTLLFATWFYFDVTNYIEADRIYNYKSWFMEVF